MIEISEDLIIGSIVFLFLLMTGVIGALASAKKQVIMSLFEVLFDVGVGSDPITILPAGIILGTIVVVFVAIPGTIGLFRLLTSR